MRHFIATLAVLFLVQSHFSAERGGVFELRRVAERASENTVPMEYKAGKNSETLHVEKKALLDGSAVESAKVSSDPVSGQPIVEVKFNEEGTKKFSDISAENIKKRIAIVVDGKVVTAPIVQTRIPGGRVHITGDLTKEQAEELVRMINRAAGKTD